MIVGLEFVFPCFSEGRRIELIKTVFSDSRYPGTRPANSSSGDVQDNSSGVPGTSNQSQVNQPDPNDAMAESSQIKPPPPPEGEEELAQSPTAALLLGIVSCKIHKPSSSNFMAFFQAQCKVKSEEDAQTAQAVASALIKRIVDYKAGSVQEKHSQGVRFSLIYQFTILPIAPFSSSAPAARASLPASTPS